MSRGESTKRSGRRWLIIGALLAVLIGVFAWIRTLDKIAHDPRVVFLTPAHGAQWIRVGRPSSLQAKRNSEIIHEFRTRFTVREPMRDPMLTFVALTSAAVYLDGSVIYSSADAPEKWKEPQTISLAPVLSAGTHDLLFAVRTQNGAVALMAWSDALGISTGTADGKWEVREGFTPDRVMSKTENDPWFPAELATTVQPTELSQEFPTVAEATRAASPMIVPVFLLLTVGCLLLDRGGGSRWKELAGAPSTWRWVLMAACAVLWINNIFKVPLNVGFDIADGHVAYIRYVADNLAVPYAGDGWQMFQSPLYYIVSAALWKAASPLMEPDKLLRLLRIIPVMCGLAQIEICYRALKLVFPENRDAQRLGLLVGGLLPMNLYISNYVGNETMAGALSALVVLLSLRIIVDPKTVASRRWQIALGTCLGLALLSKVTAVLLFVPVFAAAAYASTSVERGFGRRAVIASSIFGVAALISGWYYLRNWIKFGVPFLGGWDDARGIVWSQDPGYRTVNDFTSFSRALMRPINSSFYGFWDGLYSTFWLDGHLSSMDKLAECPPWNFTLMLSAPWLALLPTGAMLVGALAVLWYPSKTVRGVLLFCACCVAIYLAAMLQLTLLVPTYSTVKATYSLGLVPCYGILAAAGFTLLCRHRLLRALAYGWIGTFAVVIFCTYFAV